ncbi:MAG: Cache 3/Cache 2 fusion domain-containing protein [Deltaproteobacteria bacterium]|nr:Cache 3/Cache 2 fusion domain-containing protein [Deltaproteobacteria bacterium]
MLTKRSLKAKLIALGVLLSVVPLLVINVTTALQNSHTSDKAGNGLSELAFNDLDHTLHGILAMVSTQQQVLQQQVTNALNVSQRLLRDAGGVRLASDATVSWQAVNQLTEETGAIELPRLMVGDAWLGQNRDPASPTPIVDDVKSLVGGTCTIFQRMNVAGDMLRVATNVEKLDHTRAIGTYIPALNPDGKANPVVATLLKGETYYGRAFVVNAWYITAYEPLRNDRNEIMGALYFGIPQESATALRKAVMDVRIGKTGYVYVLDSKGNYIISKDGKQDGKNIKDATDADGRYFVREIIAKAATSKSGEVFEARYPWKNSDREEARTKVVRLGYFAPWDWIIGVGVYEEELFEARNDIEAYARRNLAVQLAVTSATLLLTICAWWLVSGRIGRRLTAVTTRMQSAAEQVFSASGQVSDASQQLAEGATQQAAAIEETSASLEEMAAMTMRNADHARDADLLMHEAGATIDRANETIGRMTVSMEEINKSGEETQKIIDTIDKIAFQTNLLALNAAVEAARAGQAGAGFAVVATEVRNLAVRAGEAAKNTSELIQGSVKHIKEGSTLLEVTNKAFDEVAVKARQVTQLISEIATASDEQAKGIGQVNSAVGEMDKVVQQNAAAAEESAGSSREMSTQAEVMKAMVAEMVAVVNGARQFGTPATKLLER